MKGARLLFVASWVLLLVMSLGLVFISVLSLNVAFFSQDTLVPGFTTDQLLTAGGEEVVKAFRGRRVTAATFTLGLGLLSAFVVFIPYRKGERWAWWALLTAILASQLLSLSRLVVLGTASGTTAAGILLAIFLLGLMMGAPYMFRRVDLSEL